MYLSEHDVLAEAPGVECHTRNTHSTRPLFWASKPESGSGPCCCCALRCGSLGVWWWYRPRPGVVVWAKGSGGGHSIWAVPPFKTDFWWCQRGRCLHFLNTVFLVKNVTWRGCHTAVLIRTQSSSFLMIHDPPQVLERMMKCRWCGPKWAAAHTPPPPLVRTRACPFVVLEGEGWLTSATCVPS